YLLGGFGDAGHRSASVQVADVMSDGSVSVWRTTTPLTFGREGPGVAILGGRIYVLGGYLEGPIVNTVQSAPIPETGDIGDWRDETPMLVDRYNPLAFAGLTKLFVGGGTPAGDGCTNTLASFEEATVGPDDVLGSWTASSSLNVPRNGFGGAVVGATAVVSGG